MFIHVYSWVGSCIFMSLSYYHNQLMAETKSIQIRQKRRWNHEWKVMQFISYKFGEKKNRMAFLISPSVISLFIHLIILLIGFEIFKINELMRRLACLLVYSELTKNNLRRSANPSIKCPLYFLCKLHKIYIICFICSEIKFLQFKV
jgi:hypothetical protein